MKKVAAAWKRLNRKIDGLWDEKDESAVSEDVASEGVRSEDAVPEGVRSEDAVPEGVRSEGAASETDQKKAVHAEKWVCAVKKFVVSHPADLSFVLLMGVFLFYLAWILPFNEAPDEKMRYLVPTYIYRHGTLPAGWDEEVLNKMWGISYAFHPILPYIIGGYLMRLVGIFNSSEHALLMAARMVNVFLGMGFYWYVLKISRRLFRKDIFRIYFVALLACLPQLLYLFVYVNTDGIAMFSTAILIDGWLTGMEQKWNRGSCTRLAVGVSVCAMSYFNAYGFALFSVVIFAGSLIVFFWKKGGKVCTCVILKRGLYITGVVFLLCGWWFIRCAVLYDGDFLGLHAPAKYGEMYAQEEFKPSVKKSVQEQGISIEKMLRPEERGGMEWIRTTYRSTIGYFGYLRYPLGQDIYGIPKRLVLLGAIGCLLHVFLTVFKLAWNFAMYQKEQKKLPVSFALPGINLHPVNFFLLQISLGCCIIIPILLSLVYSYTDDFQPQGRYIMPLIIPLAWFVAAGTERVMTLFFKKWVGYLLMLPLLYAVLHVFLAAFVSVYIPTFVQSAGWLADIRFPWFSNQSWIVTFLHLFIPG